jgi:hypothetical protein
MTDVIAAVTALTRERDELAHLNDLLAARVAELEDTDAERRRLDYRRGYWAGRASVRRGAASTTSPELRARGDLRHLRELTKRTGIGAA